jgi:hopene-associated glycosyltransferase HpnB
VLVLAVLTVLAAIAWLYLLAGHGGYWRTSQRLPATAARPAGRPAANAIVPAVPAGGEAALLPAWPGVSAVVPARDEAGLLPATLPALLRQDYPGDLTVILVDDASSDGTAEAAERIGRDTLTSPGSAGRRAVRVVRGRPTPEGWAGKVWAMAQGLKEAGSARYVLFTDADIAYRPHTLTSLVAAAEGDRRDLVSQMALLRAESFWERVLVPAFVYFFAQLYPFRRVNRPGSRTAAAAGGCMLVRRRALDAGPGLAAIGGARIDDVALGRLLKRPPASGRCWLGLSTSVISVRPYPGLAGLWHMVARSAYTQLRYSPALLAATIAGLLWLYALPPAAALAGLATLAAGGGPAAAWCAGAGLASWLIMSVSFVPMLRLYRLSPLRAPSLPLIALLYAAMTADSARRHHVGQGGEWKGRVGPR